MWMWPPWTGCSRRATLRAPAAVHADGPSLECVYDADWASFAPRGSLPGKDPFPASDEDMELTYDDSDPADAIDVYVPKFLELTTDDFDLAAAIDVRIQSLNNTYSAEGLLLRATEGGGAFCAPTVAFEVVNARARS